MKKKAPFRFRVQDHGWDNLPLTFTIIGFIIMFVLYCYLFQK